MSTISKHLFVALIGASILSSCSRPVAYFQPTQREHFTAKTAPVAPVTPAEAAAEPTAIAAPAAEVVSAPAEQVAQAKQAISQIEAYVRNDSKLASNKKLTKRMAKINELLATASDKAAVSTNVASTKKMSLVERAMLKKIDKKIKNHVAPEDTKALNRNTKNGIIIGAIGLLLSLIFTGVIGVIGLVLLVVGIVLILLGVLES
ncbi:hypothetical protein [Spirosoma oryzicola]|uniref:hypothetical protein n=1 Tax=Spirosoma oryzicola TaxID=2898794 RepID=UPI001E2AD459|nr:hypothetical protein [Spirosoma oryzicola]UHG92400.1 hypothetical protein LQ777_05725 [Spirosoma oryzicola]